MPDAVIAGALTLGALAGLAGGPLGAGAGFLGGALGSWLVLRAIGAPGVPDA